MTKIIKVFVKASCPNCPVAREVAGQFETAELYDMDTASGLSEAAFYSVLSTPTFLLVDRADNILASWRGEVPRPDELAKLASAA